MIPNRIRQVTIDEKVHIAIINLIFVILQLDKVGRTVADVREAWERFVGQAGEYNWGEFASAATDSSMLKDALHTLKSRPIRFPILLKALQAVDPWTPISKGGYFGIVEDGEGVRVMEAGKTCPHDRTLLVASNVLVTHWAWTKGVQMPLSEEGDDAWGADLIPYDPASLATEGLVPDPMFQTAMDTFNVPLNWVLNVVFNAPEGKTGSTTPRAAMLLVANPRGLTQNDISRLVYMAKEAMDRKQMYQPGHQLQQKEQPTPIMGGRSAKGALVNLLITLFSSSELRRFIRYRQEGDSVARNLPGESTSLWTLVAAVADQYEQRGLINSTLFDELIAERPRRREEITDVRSLFGI